MTDFGPAAPLLAQQRRELAPEIHDAFQAFGEKTLATGALPSKTKQLIAIAVAHSTQCPYCITAHTKAAEQEGASGEEIMEAIWVAALLRAGGTFAHSRIALAALDHSHENGPSTVPQVDERS